ncbi:sterol carrier family protein [Corynebacterium anserum]|uniref:sterol carrier family protein n=1 Tax=Corynebacterium anserum TaxID=2684406 RepID=UPI001640A3DA|nr:sterol carrier family protein [Corynebacterium anserum]
MKRGLKGPELSAAARQAVEHVLPWVRDESAPHPSRLALAEAVRLSVQVLEELAPGHAVEVRVPPFVAVQCVQGPAHRRGTPPNVVECAPREWLRVAVGDVSFADATLDASGTRAVEVASFMPLFRFDFSSIPRCENVDEHSSDDEWGGLG